MCSFVLFLWTSQYTVTGLTSQSTTVSHDHQQQQRQYSRWTLRSHRERTYHSVTGNWARKRNLSLDFSPKSDVLTDATTDDTVVASGSSNVAPLGVSSLGLESPITGDICDDYDRPKRGVRKLTYYLKNRKRQLKPVDAAALLTQDRLLEEEKQKSTRVPSYKKLLLFCIAPLLIWLSEPLLSLVDTTVVGLTMKGAKGVTQLAAMGPATTLMDLSLYMTFFLAIATTNQLAEANTLKDYRKLQRITSNNLGVALVAGVTVTTALLLGGPWMLKSMVGTSTASAAEITHLATRYCWIRGMVAPLSVMGMVGQSFCLATLDTKTPIKAVAAASVCNVIGDLALSRFGMQGAAVATSISSAIASTILLRSVFKKMKEWRRLEKETVLKTDDLDDFVPDLSLESFAYSNGTGLATSTALAAVSPDAAASHIASLQNTETDKTSSSSSNTIPLMSLPDRKSFAELLKISLPLAFNMWAKYGSYFTLTVAASPFGPVALASHNVMMRVFFFFGCFADCLCQTAQTFLPAALYPVKVNKDYQAILKKLTVMAAGVAAFNFVGVKWVLKNCGTIFSKDVGILNCLSGNAMTAAIALALHPIIMAAEGTVISTRKFKNLVRTYIVTLGIHTIVLKTFAKQSFGAVWQSLIIFQVVRMLNYAFWGKLLKNKTSEDLVAVPVTA